MLIPFASCFARPATFRADELPYALMWTDHNVALADRVTRRHVSGIRQHIQHLLVPQRALESVQGSE